MIPWLSDNTPFPPLNKALDDPNGLLAAGGTLNQGRLLDAYRRGIFPWYSPGEPILWWSPDPRCVLIPEQLHVSRSLKKQMRSQTYEVCFDRNFPAVIDACAAPRSASAGTWITREMRQSYIELHKSGYAHSVEMYQEGEIVGGLYGLALGKLFFGESMFSRRSNASKIAFVHLVEQLKKWGYALIDCQVSNPHLFSLGACEIPRQEFEDYLQRYLNVPHNHHWDFEPDLFRKE
ncbi:leucyl/phenylalanyl-tRNA--protein transferase [Neptuniibacter sp. CAU 1671]|uniref:leucyl/phenylalanyl-tRNA--protein transferase n=1 Tax=Neptuniibacter sp. CAU 1671 TaxID=3032593 RepID=UPI0023DB5F9B|nr:leucyl/phenylalanyl-tRNA--protein transferase [Neptuniibacter sp. CAU 1671]MDF2180478.1 leucyl/phenylalanyl-tRNA--protein transferase [Neptuniibacter sp. CAU 1671]